MVEFLPSGRLVFRTNNERLEIVDIQRPREAWRCQIHNCGRWATQRFTEYCDSRPFLFCYQHYPYVRYCPPQEKKTKQKKSEVEKLSEWSMKK